MSISTWFRNLFAPVKGGIFNVADVDPAPRKPKRGKVIAGPLTISEEAVNLIVEFEVGGWQYYEKKLQHPTWPGGASGVTIGFGYDVGYNTPTQIRFDWSGKLPAEHVERLARLSGVRGNNARQLTKSLSFITVPWAMAREVFENQTLPRFGKMADVSFPHLVDCHPHVQGAMLSVVFNRGPALTGKNREDMNDINRILADGVQTGDYAKIAAQLREMKAIWKGKGLDGLIRRREAEARLVEAAIT